MALVMFAAATGVLHISVAELLGVLLMADTGCIQIRGMYRAVEWRVILLITGMIPLGIAMDDGHAGTASWLAGLIVEHTSAYGPLIVMASMFMFTALLTQITSNASAAVVLAPSVIATVSLHGVDGAIPSVRRGAVLLVTSTDDGVVTRERVTRTLLDRSERVPTVRAPWTDLQRRNGDWD